MVAPSSNTQYICCACSKCPGTGKLKTDIDNSFEILRQHNYNSRLYGFEAKALEIVLQKEAAKKVITLKSPFDADIHQFLQQYKAHLHSSAYQ